MRMQTIVLALLIPVFSCGCDLEELLDDLIINIRIDGPEPNYIIADPPAGSTTVDLCVGEVDFWPPHTRGDRDFKGHGPLVQLDADLRVNTTDNTIEVRLYMKAEEWENGPEDDNTTARGWTPWQVVRPPAGKRIIGLAQGQETRFHHSYLDDNHDDDGFLFSASRLIGQLIYTGDTSGNEAGTRTGVTADFNCVRAVLVDE